MAAFYFSSPDSPVPKANGALELMLGVHHPFPISSQARGSRLCCFTSPLPLLPQHFCALAANFALAARSQAPFQFPFSATGREVAFLPCFSPMLGSRTQLHRPSPRIYGASWAGSCTGKPIKKQIKLPPLQPAQGPGGAAWVCPGQDRTQHSPRVGRPVISGNKSGQYLKIKVLAGARFSERAWNK